MWCCGAKIYYAEKSVTGQTERRASHAVYRQEPWKAHTSSHLTFTITITPPYSMFTMITVSSAITATEKKRMINHNDHCPPPSIGMDMAGSQDESSASQQAAAPIHNIPQNGAVFSEKAASYKVSTTHTVLSGYQFKMQTKNRTTFTSICKHSSNDLREGDKCPIRYANSDADVSFTSILGLPTTNVL